MPPKGRRRKNRNRTIPSDSSDEADVPSQSVAPFYKTLYQNYLTFTCIVELEFEMALGEDIIDPRKHVGPKMYSELVNNLQPNDKFTKPLAVTLIDNLNVRRRQINPLEHAQAVSELRIALSLHQVDYETFFRVFDRLTFVQDDKDGLDDFDDLPGNLQSRMSYPDTHWLNLCTDQYVRYEWHSDWIMVKALSVPIWAAMKRALTTTPCAEFTFTLLLPALPNTHSIFQQISPHLHNNQKIAEAYQLCMLKYLHSKLQLLGFADVGLRIMTTASELNNEDYFENPPGILEAKPDSKFYLVYFEVRFTSDSNAEFALAAAISSLASHNDLNNLVHGTAPTAGPLTLRIPFHTDLLDKTLYGPVHKQSNDQLLNPCTNRVAIEADENNAVTSFQRLNAATYNPLMKTLSEEPNSEAINLIEPNANTVVTLKAVSHVSWDERTRAQKLFPDMKDNDRFVQNVKSKVMRWILEVLLDSIPPRTEDIDKQIEVLVTLDDDNGIECDTRRYYPECHVIRDTHIFFIFKHGSMAFELIHKMLTENTDLLTLCPPCQTGNMISTMPLADWQLPVPYGTKNIPFCHKLEAFYCDFVGIFMHHCCITIKGSNDDADGTTPNEFLTVLADCVISALSAFISHHCDDEAMCAMETPVIGITLLGQDLEEEYDNVIGRLDDLQKTHVVKFDWHLQRIAFRIPSWLYEAFDDDELKHKLAAVLLEEMNVHMILDEFKLTFNTGGLRRTTLNSVKFEADDVLVHRMPQKGETVWICGTERWLDVDGDYAVDLLSRAWELDSRDLSRLNKISFNDVIIQVKKGILCRELQQTSDNLRYGEVATLNISNMMTCFATWLLDNWLRNNETLAEYPIGIAPVYYPDDRGEQWECVFAIRMPHDCLTHFASFCNMASWLKQALVQDAMTNKCHLARWNTKNSYCGSSLCIPNPFTRWIWRGVMPARVPDDWPGSKDGYMDIEFEVESIPLTKLTGRDTLRFEADTENSVRSQLYWIYSQEVYEQKQKCVKAESVDIKIDKVLTSVNKWRCLHENSEQYRQFAKLFSPLQNLSECSNWALEDPPDKHRNDSEHAKNKQLKIAVCKAKEVGATLNQIALNAKDSKLKEKATKLKSDVQAIIDTLGRAHEDCCNTIVVQMNERKMTSDDKLAIHMFVRIPMRRQDVFDKLFKANRNWKRKKTITTNIPNLFEDTFTTTQTNRFVEHAGQNVTIAHTQVPVPDPLKQYKVCYDYDNDNDMESDATNPVLQTKETNVVFECEMKTKTIKKFLGYVITRVGAQDYHPNDQPVRVNKLQDKVPQPKAPENNQQATHIFRDHVYAVWLNCIYQLGWDWHATHDSQPAADLTGDFFRLRVYCRDVKYTAGTYRGKVTITIRVKSQDAWKVEQYSEPFLVTNDPGLFEESTVRLNEQGAPVVDIDNDVIFEHYGAFESPEREYERWGYHMAQQYRYKASKILDTEIVKTKGHELTKSTKDVIPYLVEYPVFGPNEIDSGDVYRWFENQPDVRPPIEFEAEKSTGHPKSDISPGRRDQRNKAIQQTYDGLDSQFVPEEYQCGITGQLMTEPVIAFVSKTSHVEYPTYEQANIANAEINDELQRQSGCNTVQEYLDSLKANGSDIPATLEVSVKSQPPKRVILVNKKDKFWIPNDKLKASIQRWRNRGIKEGTDDSNAGTGHAPSSMSTGAQGRRTLQMVENYDGVFLKFPNGHFVRDENGKKIYDYPNEYNDDITDLSMENPVIAFVGNPPYHTYDRSRVTVAIKEFHKEPLKQVSLTEADLIPNDALKKAIVRWRHRGESAESTDLPGAVHI